MSSMDEGPDFDRFLLASFPHSLPSNRLGLSHNSLGSFRSAISGFFVSSRKEYTAIVVTDLSCGDDDYISSATATATNDIASVPRILLGLKHRGFGTGLYNSFGGKVDPGESIDESARRELIEETGIAVDLASMKSSRLGTLFFTFDDSQSEMVVYLFHVDIRATHKENPCSMASSSTCPVVDLSKIQGCDEITPCWFDIHAIPLFNMFADDSVWLTRLLLMTSMYPSKEVRLDGWFHFEPGGAEVNTIRHYHLHMRHIVSDEVGCCVSIAESGQPERDSRQQPLTLEKQLFYRLHQSGINSPRIKEFNEAWAFVGALRLKKNCNIKLIVDVAGGHGALAALLLITTKATRAVVIDPGEVGNGAVERAWGSYWRSTKNDSSKQLQYRHECLRSGLPSELNQAIQLGGLLPSQILVVACHACQHLSDETLDINLQYGVHVAVMPCCQRDTMPGGPWKAASRNLELPVSITMDLLLAGKAMSWNVGRAIGVAYDVRMKVINASITPQNRIIYCKPQSPFMKSSNCEGIDRAHEKLKQAYAKAHQTANVRHKGTSGRSTMHCQTMKDSRSEWRRLLLLITFGFFLGALVTAACILRLTHLQQNLFIVRDHHTSCKSN